MNQRLYEIAYHAYTTVPYYKNLIKDKPEILENIRSSRRWEQLPVIEKNNIVLCQDKLVSDDYLGELVMGRLIRSHTSGSTGTYLDIYWSEADRSASLLPLWMERYRYAGVRTRDHVCLFNTALEEDYQIKSNKMILSKQRLTRKKLQYLYEKMREFQPVWMLLHPGIAEMLLQMVKEGESNPIPCLRYIELTGEMVLEGLIPELEKTFGCKVRCHYGTMEVSTIGYQKGKNYKLFPNSTYVEILDKEGNLVNDGEYGNIYVTSLHNRAMPFIRYGIGDIGRVVSRKNETIELELKQARKNDLLELPDGSKIPPDALLEPVERINGAMERVVYQFQVFQQSRNSLLIKVVLDPEVEGGKFEQWYWELFREDWKEEFSWGFQYENEVQVNQATGKSGWFFSQYKEK